MLQQKNRNALNRKKLNNEIKETVLQAVDYTNTDAERVNKRVRIFNSIALILT